MMRFRDMRDGLLKAIDSKDVDSVLTYLHEDVVLVAQAGEQLQLSRGHNAVRDYLDQLLTGEDAGVQSLNLNVEVKELTTLHGDDTGVSFGTSDDHYVLRDGTEFDLATVWSATLVKDETFVESGQFAVVHQSLRQPSTRRGYRLSLLSRRGRRRGRPAHRICRRATAEVSGILSSWHCGDHWIFGIHAS